MKLHQAKTGAANVITGYGEDHVVVNGQRWAASCVVTPQAVQPWPPRAFGALSEADLEPLAALGAEILLLGTGMRQRFPPPRLLAPLLRARVGVEVMDLKAACRTYNILVAEERKVAAALLIESPEGPAP